MGAENDKAGAAGVAGQGNQAGQSAGAGTGQTGASGTQQFPWQSDERFREKGPEDIWKSYQDAQSQLGKSAQYKANADFVEQLGGKENVQQWLTWAQDVYGKAQRGEITLAQAKREVTEGTKEWYNGADEWDAPTLAQRVAERASGQALAYAQQREQAIVQQLQQWQQQQTQMFEIYRMALEEKFKNPDLPLDGLLQQMVSLASNKPQDLMGLAVRNMTSEKDIEATVNARVAQRLAEEKQKLENSTLGSVRTGGRFALRAPESRGVNQSERDEGLIQEMIKKGIISPAQV